MCLTNQGDLCIHSLPDLRRQVLTNCIRKEDVIAISTLVLSKKGEAFYMCSPSELQRVSVAAARVLRPSGVLCLPPGARPEPTPASPPPSQQQQPTVTVTTPEEGESAQSEERENEQNEQAAANAQEGVERRSAPPQNARAASSPTDQHNDTTVSEISADITLDSVKDHTQAAAAANESALSSSSAKTEKPPAEASGDTTVAEQDEAPADQQPANSNVNGSETQGESFSGSLAVT